MFAFGLEHGYSVFVHRDRSLVSPLLPAGTTPGRVALKLFHSEFSLHAACGSQLFEVPHSRLGHLLDRSFVVRR